MLKSELVRPRLVMQAGQVSTRPIPADYHYLAVAGELTSLFHQHLGRTRGALAEALREYEGDSLDYPVIRGLAAVLEGQCVFGAPLLDGRDPPLKPADLRAALFRRGPVTDKPDLFAPLTRGQALKEAAAEFGLTGEQAEAAMFADLAEEQVLLGAGPSITPADLIARYNLELARGLLYWAREMRIVVRDNYKDIFRYVKLFRLMYEVRPDLSPGPSPTRGGEFSPSRRGKAGGGLAPSAYHITLFGPISPFVKSTQRYGIQFAKFLPALMLCSSWRMEADVCPPRTGGAKPITRNSQPETYLYTLDDSTELRTHFKPSGEFDSRLEADFAAEFEAKYGGVEREWVLAREDELIPAGDAVMIPDFSFTHRKDGRRALLEIVGFWHPNYLRRKLEKVRQAQRGDLILLVYESACVAEGKFDFAAASPGEVLTFKRKPVLKDVLAAVERCALAPP
ncbi:MAG: DUF790 family protein [Thermoflexales bacterium]|nr:DUF790 family protein [Thermoflexales bacterium]